MRLDSWSNIILDKIKFYLFLRSLARSYFPFLEIFTLSETVLIIDRHLMRSFTVSFQLCRIFAVFKMLLQLSLKRSLGRSIGREPPASSPYNNHTITLYKFYYLVYVKDAPATINNFVQARLRCLQRQTLRVLLHYVQNQINKSSKSTAGISAGWCVAA